MTARLAVHARTGAVARRLSETLAPDPTTVVVDVADAAQQLVAPALAHPVLATAELDGEPHVLLGLRMPAWVAASAVERLADEPELALLRHAAPLLASRPLSGSTPVPVDHDATFIVLASDRDELRVRRRGQDGELVGPAMQLAREDIAALFVDAEPEAPARAPVDPAGHSAFLRRLLHLDDAPDELSARDLLDRAPRWRPYDRKTPHSEFDGEAPQRSHAEAPHASAELHEPRPPADPPLTARPSHADPKPTSDPPAPHPFATTPIASAPPPATHEVQHAPTPVVTTRPDVDAELRSPPSPTPQLSPQAHASTSALIAATPASSSRAPAPLAPDPAASTRPEPIAPFLALPSPLAPTPVSHATPHDRPARAPALPAIDHPIAALAITTSTDPTARTPRVEPTLAHPQSPQHAIATATTTTPTARESSATFVDTPLPRSPKLTTPAASSPPPISVLAATIQATGTLAPTSRPDLTAPPTIPQPPIPLLLRQLARTPLEPSPIQPEASPTSPSSLAHRLVHRPRRATPTASQSPPPLLAAEDHHIGALEVDLTVTCGPVRVDTSTLASIPGTTTAAPLTPGALLRRVPRGARLGGLL